MIDAASVQAIAAVGALMLALITLIGGWTWWLVRDLDRNLRREMGEIRSEMRRNHREILALLEGHTHGNDGAAVFRRFPDG